MVIVLLVKNLTDAISQMYICSNFFHDCSLKGPIVNVKLDNNKVSWLAYAANYVQRMRGLLKIICDWGVVEVKSAQASMHTCSHG